ncbi:cell division protein FtsA [Bacteroidia bacterium]|nr:cell division protein FtsA [Bacteroidia bacterium]
MKKTSTPKYAMAIDIGTTKIAIMVGKIIEGRRTIVIQHAIKSQGVKRGAVENVDETARSIKACLDVVKRQMSEKGIAFDAVRKVNVGVAGSHIESTQNSNTLTRSKRTPIEAKEIDALTLQMNRMALKPGKQILHVIPKNYRVDDNYVSCNNIVGTTGSHIVANYHINIADTEAIEKIKYCVEQCGLEVGNLIFEPLASADAVLTSEDKECGVAVVDLGGGTSDMVIYLDNEIKATYVLAYGGEYVTTDIAKTCYLEHAQAEALKVNYGACYCDKKLENKTWAFPSDYGQEEPHTISATLLSQIIRARMKDIMEVIDYNIELSGCDIDRIVLTGGGAALEALPQFAQYVTSRKVRVGCPYVEIEGSGKPPQPQHPRYATCVGLVFAENYAQRNRKQDRFTEQMGKFWEKLKVTVVDNIFNEDEVIA